MNENIKKIPADGAGQAAGAAEAVTPITTPEAAEKPAGGDSGVYEHVFKKPFEHEGKTYTTIVFDFRRMTGRDMLAIETEMQMNNEYALAAEVSKSFQAKLAARAAGIGSDVIEAMPLNDFNKITNAARTFLLDTGY